jgi:hypothetical protein
MVFCYSDRRERPVYAIWGDSHANQLMWGLVRQSAPGERWIFVGAYGCPPMGGTVVRTLPGDPGYDTPRVCRDTNSAALLTLEGSPIKAVLLATAERMVTPNIYAKAPGQPDDPDAIVEGLSEAAGRLLKAGKSVYFLIDNPTFSRPKDCLERYLHLPHTNQRCTYTLKELSEARRHYTEVIAAVKQRVPEVTIIDASDVLCPDGVCSIAIDRRYLYSDGDHLSDIGNGLVAARVIQRIRETERTVTATAPGRSAAIESRKN